MESTKKILVFSDEYDMETLINIIHDNGIKTDGMTREIIGDFEENVAWKRCKSHEINALVIDLLNDDNGVYFHDIDMVENKPLYLYALTIVVDDDDDDTKATEEEEQEQEEENMENATLNIGMITHNYMPINIETAEKIIGLTTDCTITRCTGFYKGHMEPSLKVEIYGVSAEKAVDLAHEFARDFNQECVSCTIKWKTVFVAAMATLEERQQMTKELEEQ